MAVRSIRRPKDRVSDQSQNMSSLTLSIGRERQLAVVAGMFLLFLMSSRVWWLPVHAPLNVNEGWNATPAVRAVGEGTLYPSAAALTANNYPPLSFYVVGFFGRVVGDNVVAGRILALFAQFSTGVAVCLIVGRLVNGTRSVVISGMLFAGFGVTLLRFYFGINDPQWLGEAAMSWALLFVIPRRVGDAPSIVCILVAVGLTIAGGLIKHNLVAMPLATTVWLWLVYRRAFYVWALAGIVMAAVVSGLLLAAWGPTVFVDVLSPARSYSFARMVAKGGPLLLAMLPSIIACRALHPAWREDRRLLLPALLLAFAVPLGILQRAGVGVDVNAFFGAVVAVSIAVPVALACRHSATLAWIVVVTAPIVCLIPVAFSKSVSEFVGRDAAVQRTSSFVNSIATAPGPVACDDQAICYWAARESALDFFSVNQRLLKGRAAALRRALERGHFAMIYMRSDNPGWNQNLLIPEIKRRYRVIYRSGGSELLIPNTQE